MSYNFGSCTRYITEEEYVGGRDRMPNLIGRDQIQNTVTSAAADPSFQN